MNEVLKKLQAIGLIPVIKIEDIDKAVPLAKALCDGGLPCAEITFRAAGADKAIAAITAALPEMLVGAGTVLTCEQVDAAVKAGAKFIVSPGLNPRVVKYCVEKGIPVTPGCSNPSDIEQAIELGLEVVKFFPAESIGGIKAIKAMSAPYSQMKFIPTGGINAQNMKEYLAFNKILACGGSWMVKEDLIKEGKFAEITALARQAVQEMLGFELAHIGINANDEGEAERSAGMFSALFGWKMKNGNSSIFAGTEVEMMKTPGLGRNGHIGVKTNSMLRAVSYLKMMGFEFNEDSAKYNDKGELTALYLKEEISGFAVHLVQK
ncbi:MAG: bifunctional 4-hydroxy-2-oxoglutarate aldolase/2-dehydro-3-deoxy-phosphogluconate aldolase [Clostridiales bacterium]|nr:bifunctional 4-hydroxy-2-oxoglutarate aldolase/2-dehydro-3-deoxy-phosphogluconate aldolase [Clostridiales bacterium]